MPGRDVQHHFFSLAVLPSLSITPPVPFGRRP
jgi:hypothetical protein